MLVFGFGTKGFSYALADAYNVLIGNGWTVKDALGFLGTSIAGTIAMNPSLAPGVAAGALSAYIMYKGAQLYDIYREWRNLRTGIAMLNPVQYSESMSVKQLRKGEYGWQTLEISVRYKGSGYWWFYFEYVECYNNNGSVSVTPESYRSSGSLTKSFIISELNGILSVRDSRWKDEEGKAILTSVVQTAYNYLLYNTAYSAAYSRQVVAALETDVVSSYDSALGYRVNVDPANISEDGVQYLNDPDAFYNWFVQNYMYGTNDGTFVTPTAEAYDDIRSDLQTIITQLNTLVSSGGGGGVSEETLNQLKTEILNAMNTRLSAVDTKLESVDSKLTGIDTKLSGLDSSLTGVSDNLNSLQTDISSLSNSIDTEFDALQSDLALVKTSVDALTTTIDEAQQEEQGFWDGLMEWLNVSLWEKLQELLKTLFLPTEEQLDTLFSIELPEYQMEFVPEVSFSSESATLPISLYGANVDLAGYISEYASGLRTFMNIFVSGMAAIFVIRAFRVHLNID